MKVDKVFDQGGVVIHYGEVGEGFREGSEATLLIDWPRRHLNMRFHTAGHIIDYAVTQSLQLSLESGRASHAPPEGYVEYVGARRPPDKEELEKWANHAVASARPVKAIHIRSEDLQKYVFGAPNMARLPVLPSYRVIVIEDINAIPCAGTHTANTSEVGRIMVTKIEVGPQSFRVAYTLV